MPKYLTALTGLAASLTVVALTAGTAFAGDITGTITYTGKVPTLKPIAMDADPVCKTKHSTPVPSEALVLGAGNTMGNVMVRVKGPVQGSFPVPATPVVIDQKGCQYHPHVLGIRVGQTLQLRNSDALLHNVHALPKVNTPFNMAMPANRLTADSKFGKEEGMFLVKCDVHGWMTAYVGVFANPFFSVSGTDGKYKISGLPPGNYEIEAWHEKLGTQTMKVTVAAAKPGAANFSFAPPAK
jgi:plastocyanin